jgi:hypothetical protein
MPQRGHHLPPIENPPSGSGGEQFGVALGRPVHEQRGNDRDDDLAEGAVQAGGHHDGRTHDRSVDRIGELPLVRPSGADPAGGPWGSGLGGSGFVRRRARVGAGTWR